MKQKTIDMTPTWEAMVPVMFEMYNQANPENKKVIQSEFIRMAKVVDQNNKRKKKGECVYQEALDRINQHSEDATALAATLTNTANEVFRDAEDKELFNRLTAHISEAEALAIETSSILGDIVGLFDVELEEKINEKKK